MKPPNRVERALLQPKGGTVSTRTQAVFTLDASRVASRSNKLCRVAESEYSSLEPQRSMCSIPLLHELSFTRGRLKTSVERSLSPSCVHGRCDKAVLCQIIGQKTDYRTCVLLTTTCLLQCLPEQRTGVSPSPPRARVASTVNLSLDTLIRQVQLGYV